MEIFECRDRTRLCINGKSPWSQCAPAFGFGWLASASHGQNHAGYLNRTVIDSGGASVAGKSTRVVNQAGRVPRAATTNVAHYGQVSKLFYGVQIRAPNVKIFV